MQRDNTWLRRAVRAFTLIEVLVSLAILLAGVVPIFFILPNTFRARQEAEFLTKAAMLAQWKAEEIRRDDDTSGTLLGIIQSRTTPTTPMPFTAESKLSYSFNGRSILYADLPPSPLNDAGVARIIISLTRVGNPQPSPRDVIYELRFAY
ncbi:MAG: prepilin-type N-terminal cleavage/methylation domain-containing protein [Candidatus Sumerlaeaceae bacterium]|nr:prepilin-type N-terminal cleavage/methylation domain-containing protein [Candidatus Sumerlaeaceae bacterium]